MDVTPPLAAGQSSRRPGSPPARPRPSRAALVLRRLATAVAGLAVVALVGVACVLSFDAIRAIALAGGARADLAYLYPAGFDALLLIALIAVLLLRSARLLVLLQAWVILAVLIVAAGAANVMATTHATVGGPQLAVGIAVAPWVMLLIGLWLFLLPAGRPQGEASDDELAESPVGGGTGSDLVPFGREERDPGLAPPLETAVHATVHDHEIVPHLGSPDDLEPDVVRVVPPTPAPETPTVDELPPLRSETPPPLRTETISRPAHKGEAIPAAASRDGAPDTTAHAVTGEAEAAAAAPPRAEHAVPEAEHTTPEHHVPAPEVEQRLVPKPREQASAAARAETAPDRPQRDADRPLRWGDLVRPSAGDVLVHPLPKPGRQREQGDTQPYPSVSDRAPEQASAGAADEAAEPDTQPYPHLREEASPLPSAAPPAPRESSAAHAASAADGGPGVYEAPQDAPLGKHAVHDAVDPGPDPAHDAGSADEEEAASHGRRQPPVSEAPAPPSGRMRSTPLPPEE
ncbi:DUF2637 domain-containing protein [Sphaerisporangium dianthi]|uniref:DUF2637 domain-containing protein n=1 Tax=Sphaerisporangium dianthi TaxID=1436120 RepID=A0ABV9CC98_9ACTN